MRRKAIDLRSLRMVSFADRAKLPWKKPGVYFLFYDGLLIYVGESQHVWARCSMYGHEVYRCVKDRTKMQIGFIIKHDTDCRRQIETNAILMHQPIYNQRDKKKRANGRPKSGQKGKRK